MKSAALEPSLPVALHASQDAVPDDSREEVARQVLADNAAPVEYRLFSEFRRKLAMHEVLNKALEKLAQALRFSGRITITFHQGRITKSVLKEAYFRGRAT
jgi:hypothetical protein